MCEYLAGIGLSSCRLGVILRDCLHVGIVITIRGNWWNLEHKKGLLRFHVRPNRRIHHVTRLCVHCPAFLNTEIVWEPFGMSSSSALIGFKNVV